MYIYIVPRQVLKHEEREKGKASKVLEKRIRQLHSKYMNNISARILRKRFVFLSM